MAWNEKDFEEGMTKYIDDIYYQIFGNRLIKIYRSSREKNIDKKYLFMDIELAIDTHLTFKNGSVLTFQEKSLRLSQFNHFTFEYYNDPQNKIEGEWFKLSAQLYFCGYANKNQTGYEKYWIINVARLRTALMSRYTLKELENKFLKFNKPPAKANFFAIPFDLLEQMSNVIIYKKTIEN